jgi:hypothetical protein
MGVTIIQGREKSNHGFPFHMLGKLNLLASSILPFGGGLFLKHLQSEMEMIRSGIGGLPCPEARALLAAGNWKK